jgi:hypothetical protein
MTPMSKTVRANIRMMCCMLSPLEGSILARQPVADGVARTPLRPSVSVWPNVGLSRSR